MKLYFSHGKETGPWATKIQVLADQAKQRGHEVESLDFTDTMDPDERARRLLAKVSKEAERGVTDYALVGSSMGGYASIVASSRLQPHSIFILAPQLYMGGYKMHRYEPPCPVTVVHGWQDEVVPYQNSVRFAQQSHCSLYLIQGDHRLITSLKEVTGLFDVFLNNLEYLSSDALEVG